MLNIKLTCIEMNKRSMFRQLAESGISTCSVPLNNAPTIEKTNRKCNDSHCGLCGLFNLAGTSFKN